ASPRPPFHAIHLIPLVPRMTVGSSVFPSKSVNGGSGPVGGGRPHPPTPALRPPNRPRLRERGRRTLPSRGNQAMSEPLLATGDRLGPYRVESPLGAGGMGEVYRARDTRLGRAVAIKVLSGPHAHDPDRLRRFEQEARILAALNHANVLALHDIGS